MRVDFGESSCQDGSSDQIVVYEETSWPDQPILPREKLRILIVEDDDFDFHILRRNLLEMDAYSVKIDRAKTLAEAKLASGHKGYDVVLIDFCLGNDTGVLAIDAFGGRQSDSVIILVTGMQGREIQHIALKAGAVGCINKTQLNSTLLDATITSALHNHRLEKQLQQTIEDLEAARNEKNNFYANMSHDLKTPLNAIMGYAEIISSNCLDLPIPEKYQDYADKIRSGGLHLLEVINNLVLHSCDMADDIGGPFVDIDLNELIAKAVELVLILAQNKGISVSLNRGEQECRVRCQASLITQAFVNILSNAVKYTDTGGTILVTVACEEDVYSVIIQDSGIGMNLEEIEIAKAPFGRCKLPPHLSQEGTGLGLSIVDKIMSSHNGSLEILSDPGIGTCVTLALPKIH